MVFGDLRELSEWLRVTEADLKGPQGRHFWERITRVDGSPHPSRWIEVTQPMVGPIREWARGLVAAREAEQTAVVNEIRAQLRAKRKAAERLRNGPRKTYIPQRWKRTPR